MGRGLVYLGMARWAKAYIKIGCLPVQTLLGSSGFSDPISQQVFP